MPIVCVDIAIVSRSGCLLVRRSNAPARDAWWLPGGRVMKGERLRDAATRKAREEVGLACDIGPLIHTAETIFEDGPGDIAVHSVNVCFLLHQIGDDAVRLDGDHSDYRWVQEADPALHPYVRDCLKKAEAAQAFRQV